MYMYTPHDIYMGTRYLPPSTLPHFALSLLVHDRTYAHRHIALPPCRDLLYLAQENERLRRDLQQAILYEPPVRPLRPLRGAPHNGGSD